MAGALYWMIEMMQAFQLIVLLQLQTKNLEALRGKKGFVRLIRVLLLFFDFP
jgi:hypothetical protein